LIRLGRKGIETDRPKLREEWNNAALFSGGGNVLEVGSSGIISQVYQIPLNCSL
jgi:NhaP-type Na+/H+ or K+/H+ antiporter